MITFLTFFASGLALLAEGRYIISILQKKTKPSFSSWFIFTLSMLCVFASAYTLGARESLYLIGTFCGLNIIITILAFRHGFVRFPFIDIVFLVCTALGIFLWWQTSSPWYALLMSILIDTCGYIIMLKKLYQNLGTEDAWAWAMSMVAYSINILILLLLSQFTLSEYLFSLSNVFWCSVTFLLALRVSKSRTERNRYV